MADTDLNLSYPGQVNKAGATDALFMKTFTGEVMTAFAERNVMKDLHRVRTISHGKSASFAVLGKAAARYHTPGTAILGHNQIATNERVINIDDLLIADVAIYDLDDAKNHYDVRQEYSKQLGTGPRVRQEDHARGHPRRPFGGHHRRRARRLHHQGWGRRGDRRRSAGRSHVLLRAALG